MSIIIYLRYIGILFLLFIICQLSIANEIISGNLRTELFANDHYKSNDQKREFNEYYNRTKLSLRANIVNELSLNSAIKIAEITQENEELRRNQLINGSGNRSFENHGIYLDRLYLEYRKNNIKLFAGKNTINFGQAWKRGNYIWGFNMASTNYRFSEKITFGTTIESGKEQKNGKYILTLGSYFNDDKYFDNSIITNNGDNSYIATKTDINNADLISEYEDDYTILSGDDKSFLSSYYAILDIIYDFGNNEKLSYHFGYVKSAINKRRINLSKSEFDAQKSFVANINYQYPIFRNYLPKIFIEYVLLDNYQGNKSKKAKLLNRNISLNFYQNYHLTYVTSEKKYFEIGTSGMDQSMGELSLGYQFDKNHLLNGLAIFVGVKRDRVDYKSYQINSKSTALYARYQYEF